MKTNRIIKNLAALALLSAFSLLPSALLGQGSLTPPGAPAPMMKSADQIYAQVIQNEPRTPIASAPFTISASGSYYLTTNLTVGAGNGININANNVTLDLNGFAITASPTSGSGNAIQVGQSVAVTNITILNGIISGTLTNIDSSYAGGFYDGISAYHGGYNVRVKNITITGCTENGISLGWSTSNGCSTVDSCTINTCLNCGIWAQFVYNSTVLNCYSISIDADYANGCFTTGAPNYITYKYNMP